MRHAAILGSVLVGFALASLAVQAAEGTDETDATQIQGTWLFASKIQKGVESKAESSEGSQLQIGSVTFEDQTWKAKLGPTGSPIEITGGYAVDPKQTPKVLDISVRGGDGASTDIPAIYKVEKDTLSIRIREGGGQRPADFDTPADDCLTLVFRREGK